MGETQRLAVVSDLHFRTHDEDNTESKENLAWLSIELRPGDTVLIAGDITDDGKSEQYARALAELRPLVETVKARVRVVPGNHDYGPLGNLYDRAALWRFQSFRRALGDHGDQDADPWRVLQIDTCLRTGSPLDFAQGKVGILAATRIRAFAAACKATGAISVVLCHHTPFDDDYFLRMQDRERFMRATNGIVDFVVVGHEHKRRRVRYSRVAGRLGMGTLYFSSPARGKSEIFTADDIRRESR